MYSQTHRGHRSLPRARLFTPRFAAMILGAGCLLVSSAIATIVVLYPDGIATWDHGHLSVSLDR